MDEEPALVSLPAGTYRVIAEDESYGQICVQILIDSGKITNVHLEEEWKPAASQAVAALVRLPNGACVGWSADSNRQ